MRRIPELIIIAHEKMFTARNKEVLYLRWNERYLRAYFEIIITLMQS